MESGRCRHIKIDSHRQFSFCICIISLYVFVQMIFWKSVFPSFHSYIQTHEYKRAGGLYIIHKYSRHFDLSHRKYELCAVHVKYFSIPFCWYAFFYICFIYRWDWKLSMFVSWTKIDWIKRTSWIKNKISTKMLEKNR